MALSQLVSLQAHAPGGYRSNIATTNTLNPPASPHDPPSTRFIAPSLSGVRLTITLHHEAIAITCTNVAANPPHRRPNLSHRGYNTPSSQPEPASSWHEVAHRRCTVAHHGHYRNITGPGRHARSSTCSQHESLAASRLNLLPSKRSIVWHRSHLAPSRQPFIAAQSPSICRSIWRPCRHHGLILTRKAYDPP